MRAITIHAPHDVRVDVVPDPKIEQGGDVVVRVTHACICGTDLWAYRGVADRDPGQRMGHEFVGVVDEVGPDVTGLRPGDRVIAPFVWSDGTCDHCRRGWQTSCAQGGFWGDPGTDGGQGEAVRVPHADGTLVTLPADLDERRLPAVLALSDVLCTGHHGAVSAGAGPGSSVAVIGDGAVGLCAVLAARRLGADRVVAVARHEERAAIARAFGADEVVIEHDGDPAGGIDAVVGELGVDAVVEAVGTEASVRTAFAAVRDGGTVGFVGVPHGVRQGVDLMQLFTRNVAVRGGIAPARAYIPQLLPEVLDGSLDASPVFDLEIGLDEAPDGYRAMSERRAVKAIIHV